MWFAIGLCSVETMGKLHFFSLIHEVPKSVKNLKSKAKPFSSHEKVLGSFLKF